jgi:hypothetical protein
MCSRNGRSRLVAAVCAAALILGVQAVALGATVPPGIDDIVGTYQVSDKVVVDSFSDGTIVSYTDGLEWDVSKGVGAGEVVVNIPYWGWSFTGIYENGILVDAEGDDSSNPSSDMNTGCIVFSGSAGKVKFKGNQSWVTGAWSEWDTVSGKMVATTSFKGGNVKTTDVKAPVPTIDQVVGTYSVSMKGTGYDQATGQANKGSEADIVTITKIDDATLNIHPSDGEDKPAHYENGMVMIAEIDDSGTYDQQFITMVVSGKPGKLSMKGNLLSVEDFGGPDQEVKVGTIALKQISPP